MGVALDAEVLYGLSKGVFIELTSTTKSPKNLDTKLMCSYFLIFIYIYILIIENEKKTIRHGPVHVPCTCPIQLKPTNMPPTHPLHYLHALTQRWDTSCATHGDVQGHVLGHN